MTDRKPTRLELLEDGVSPELIAVLAEAGELASSDGGAQ